jgi:hypothetical protein
VYSNKSKCLCDSLFACAFLTLDVRLLDILYHAL